MVSIPRSVRVVPLMAAAIGSLGCPPQLPAQQMTGRPLVDALARGGYVIVLRHARSPQEPPDERTAEAENLTRERQLDRIGRDDAAAIGQAMRRLGIPVGTVLTSPTFRARQTARFAAWTQAVTVPELGDRGQSMQGVTEVEGAWLRQRVAEAPDRGNTILVTHLPNITRAFPSVEGVADGDALVFAPAASGPATLVGRIAVGDWRVFK
jgi:phosphohistidine phosphatase SixA